MKTKVWKKIAIVAAILVAAYGIALFALDTQRSLKPATETDIVASLPIAAWRPLRVGVAGDIVFKFDTGSDLSCITPEDLERLKAMGVNIRETYRPIAGRGSSDLNKASFKRYVIDLPLDFFEPSDSAGKRYVRNSERDNTLLNAEFILVEKEGERSCLGIDILSKFAVEYLYDAGLIRLHASRPDGYEDFAKLHYSKAPGQEIIPGRRYYLDLDVDHIRDSYFLDTGLRRASIKLPAGRAVVSRRIQEQDSLVSYLGVFDAKTDNAWIECGNRAGSHLAFYSDNHDEEYSFNPFNFFTQDMLIDFPSSSIALHPYVVLPSRHFLGHDTISTTSSN